MLALQLLGILAVTAVILELVPDEILDGEIEITFHKADKQ